MWHHNLFLFNQGNLKRKSECCGYQTNLERSDGNVIVRSEGRYMEKYPSSHWTALHFEYGNISMVPEKWKLSKLLMFLSILLTVPALSTASSYCGRKIVTASQGIITDGPGFYPNRRSCEWLVQAPHKNQTLKIVVNMLKVECNYDYLYIFDGGSYQSPLLASLSGFNPPEYLLSTSFQVLVVLQTDYGLEKEGFELTFEATDCPNNCSGFGICTSGVCSSCSASRKGSFCELEWCPLNCNAVSGQGVCDAAKQRCVCNHGFAGESCSLPTAPNENLNSWHTLSRKSSSFKPRSGHVGGYFAKTDSFFIFGGRSLNEVFDDTLHYNISTNVWRIISTSSKPLGRFRHAGDVYKDYLVIFGGETSNGTLLNDLWMFDTISQEWSQPANDTLNSPPGVVGHTANIVGDTLYVFGGIMQLHEFSTEIYMFDLKYSTGWKKATVLSGKPSLFRFYGHSAVYSEETKSLIFYGGESATSVRKNSAKHFRIVSFNLEHLILAELVPNQNSGHKLPLPMALHTAVIAGGYMVVYGGVVEAPLEEKCQSAEFYYYNIRCNTWVSTSFINSTSTPSLLSADPYAGRFSHIAFMRDAQTMVVVGGFNGVMFGDVMAYRFPKAITFVNSNGVVEVGGHCNIHDEKNTCYADPACGWCFSDPLICLPLNNGSTCTGNFDGRFCLSHCSAYQSCDACILYGSSANTKCSWCAQDQKCYDSSSPGGACSPSLSKNYQGWWGSSSKLLTSINQCFIENQPPGLTLAKYTVPPNMVFPDSVSIAEESKIIKLVSFTNSYRENFELTGTIYPYLFEADPTRSNERKISVTGINFGVNLFISTDQSESAKEEVAVLPSSSTASTVIAKSNSAGRLFPSPARDASYFFQCAANASSHVTNMQMFIEWNLTESRHLDKMVINASFLRPYHNGNCNKHVTCMACILDSACGWCSVTSACITRSSWNTCLTPESQVSLIATSQNMCFQCSDLYDCVTCSKNALCSWSESLQGCQRKGIDTKAVTNSSDCPSLCATRSSCDTCLADSGCRWCHEKNECFSPSTQMSKYPLGQCQIYEIRYSSTTCRNCSAHTSCSSCLADHRCGWCGTVDNPLIGKCREGDFSGPVNRLNCSIIMQTNVTVEWSYDHCPDADECRLKLDDCHSNASCINTYGSYNCLCNRGYTGDGKKQCDKTCYHDCQHGYCGPDYQCKCDLGWKGENCSINCGCNGHSTCEKGIGVCDACHNYTKGNYCDECLVGTFGDPKKLAGCKPCECNGHGIPEMGLCDNTTGKCFCKDQTNGHNCEYCDAPLTGNARNGGICFDRCSSLSLIRNASHGYLSMNGSQSSCLWVITNSNASSRDILLRKQGFQNDTSISLSTMHLALPCTKSHLYIYDGIPDDSKTRLIAVICGYNASITKQLEAKSGIVAVQYKGSMINEGFHVYFRLNHCNRSCVGNRHCVKEADGVVRCLCKPGWFGPNCNQEACPGNCSNNGYCDEKSARCICREGFFGINCSQSLESSKMYFQSFHCYNATIKPRYGQTFLLDGDRALLYGGRGLGSNIYSDVWSINLHNRSCEQLKSNNGPLARYYHCGVMYKNKMLIYGGITNNGASDKMFVFHANNQSWTEVNLRTSKPDLFPPSLSSHTCTLVGNVLYIIGGFNKTKNGLSERVLSINMTSFVMDEVAIPTIVKGLYGHSAVYDKATHNILVFGGVTFSSETVHESDILYAFDLATSSWNILQPIGNMPFPLYQHSAVLIDDTMVVIGGYSDVSSRGYNQDLLLWKKKCNQWQRISLSSVASYVPTIGQSAVLINGSIVVFGGFNTKAFNTVQKLTLPADMCNLMAVKSTCLASIGCDWCESEVLNISGVCYDMEKRHTYPCNNSGNSSGVSCDSAFMTSRDCSTFQSCQSCLSKFPTTSRPHCRWCATEGCKPPEVNCTVKSATTQIDCLDYKCEASSCEACNDDSGCMWTRHFKYLSETKRAYHSNGNIYNWNCFRRSLEGLLYVASDKFTCPNLCSSYKTCSACLSSKGAEGGSKMCYWSERLRTCFPPSFQYIACHTGDCGIVYNEASICPAMCSSQTICNRCNQIDNCGWCASPGIMGIGVCQDGGLEGPWSSASTCSRHSGNQTDSFWAPLSCPNENECLNGRHNCDSLQICVDTQDSFICECQSGYKMEDGKCNPVCSQGCDKGVCRHPDVCQCDFGWTSNNCSVQCLCNGHSNCPNETHVNICLKCHGNTQGESCGECKASFVGDPSLNLRCEPCSTRCNNRTQICLARNELSSIPDFIRKNVTLLLAYIKKGPSSTTPISCINCEGNSEGQHCEKCIPGFFEHNGKCKRCECNGHAFKCDLKTGTGCACEQNTRSEENNWSTQCNLCKDTFYGTPTNGRQCFKRMSNELSITIGKENQRIGVDSSIEGFPPKRTMFFAVPPRYTNVDIKLNVDIIEGGVDLIVSVDEADFIVEVNYTSGEHNLISPRTNSHSVSRRSIFESDEKVEQRVRRASPTVSSTQKAPKYPSNTITVSENDLSMYTEYTGGLLLIKGIQRRVIVGIKYKYLNFGKDRFYIGVITRGNKQSRNSAGYIYFRQDLSQIDLFVFFSVFFSVFFLILSFFFLSWKFKQLHRGRQAVIQQQIALETMASRPFAKYTVQCERNDSVSIYVKTHSELLEPSSSRNRRSNRRRQKTLFPMSVEFTEDELAAVVTVFIQFPENDDSLWNLSLGSAIVQATPQHVVHTATNGNDTQKTTTRFLATVNT